MTTRGCKRGRTCGCERGCERAGLTRVCHDDAVGAASRRRSAKSAGEPRPAASLAGDQRLALGATRRLADQFFPALTVDVCDNPAVGAASPISLGST